MTPAMLALRARLAAGARITEGSRIIAERIAANAKAAQR